MELNFKGKKFFIEVKNKKWYSSGLMFRSSKSDCLLFGFDDDASFDLTGLFVFFPFLSIWLNEKNEVVDWKFVKPFEWRVSCKKKFRKVLEVPVNAKNSEIIDFFRRGLGKV